MTKSTNNISSFFNPGWGNQNQEPAEEEKLSIEEAPAEAPATAIVPVETTAAPAEAPARPKKPAAKTPKTSTKNAPKVDEEDLEDKEKFSIYLPVKPSMNMRMEYILTRKKYSHIVEEALTDRYEHRYLCHSPACNSHFGGFGTDEKPVCCPFCGSKQFSQVRVDR